MRLLGMVLDCVDSVSGEIALQENPSAVPLELGYLCLKVGYNLSAKSHSAACLIPTASGNSAV